MMMMMSKRVVWRHQSEEFQSIILESKEERENKKNQRQQQQRTNQQARRRADPKQRLASRGDDRDGDGEHRDQETAVLQQNAFDERCHFFLRHDVSFVVFFAQCFFTY